MARIISHNYKIIAALTFYLEKDLCSKNKHSRFKYNLFMKTAVENKSYETYETGETYKYRA